MTQFGSIQRAITTMRAWRIRREGLGLKEPWTAGEMWEKINRSYGSFSPEDREYIFQECSK